MTRSTLTLGIFFVCALAAAGHGQDAPSADVTEDLTIEVVEEHITSLEETQEDVGLSDEDRTRLQRIQSTPVELQARPQSRSGWRPSTPRRRRKRRSSWRRSGPSLPSHRWS